MAVIANGLFYISMRGFTGSMRPNNLQLNHGYGVRSQVASMLLGEDRLGWKKKSKQNYLTLRKLSLECNQPTVYAWGRNKWCTDKLLDYDQIINAGGKVLTSFLEHHSEHLWAYTQEQECSSTPEILNEKPSCMDRDSLNLDVIWHQQSTYRIVSWILPLILFSAAIFPLLFFTMLMCTN